MKKLTQILFAAMGAAWDVINMSMQPKLAVATGTGETSGTSFKSCFQGRMTDKGPGRDEDKIAMLTGQGSEGSIIHHRGSDSHLTGRASTYSRNDGTPGDDMHMAMIGDQGEASQHGYGERQRCGHHGGFRYPPGAPDNRIGCIQ